MRSPGYVLLAIVCVAIMGVTSILTSAFVFGVKAIIAEAKLLASDVGLIMGGTGNPIPDQDYLNSVEALYLTSTFPQQRLQLRTGLDDTGAVLSDHLRLPASPP